MSSILLENHANALVIKHHLRNVFNVRVILPESVEELLVAKDIKLRRLQAIVESNDFNSYHTNQEYAKQRMILDLINATLDEKL